MQLNGIYSYKMEPDGWSEPLNLVKKKNKPVAVVAPSSVVEKNNDKMKFDSPESQPIVNEKNDCKDIFDLSVSKKSELVDEPNPFLALLRKSCLSTATSTSINDKSDDDSQKQEKISDEEDNETSVEKKQEDSKTTETAASSLLESNLKREGLYSMIHNLASSEHKFLTALYMNSLLNTPTTNTMQASFSNPMSNYLLNAGYNNSSLTSLSEAYQNRLGATPALNSLWTLADMQQRLWQMATWQENQQTSSQGSSSSTVVPIIPKIGSTAEPKVSGKCSPVPATQSADSLKESLTPSSNKIVPKKPRPSSKGSSSMDQKNTTSSGTDGTKTQESGQTSNNQDKKKPHIKKPLNAFMLYMKEMRAKVVAECTLKESAAINQILGRRWHSLSREEQAKYYEKARQERQLHMQLYPGWSARDNYGNGAKKKKRKKERSADPGGTLSSSARTAVTGDSTWHALGREEQAKYYELARRERQLHMQLYPDWSSRANSSRGKKRKRKQETNDGGNSMKKCRARYGLDQQSQWCKPCRRKKKCIRYMESGDSVDGNQSEDNLGSCGSAGEAQTPPEEDGESLHHSLSSPGGLSGLSSLTSPSMILPSPSTSLASPSVSLASPCMSLQSPLTPHESSAFECKPSMNSLSVLSNHQPASTSSSSSANAVGSGAMSVHHHHTPHHPPPPGPPLHRNPVGTNPHDINNPLSVNQLTGQCIKTENSSGNKDSSSNTRPVISVT
ncbi:Uncharacterized protein GBIM_03682 [Gryllus bimaculatus]|nr:Uncharacterized protein GBIM_03682 [Gryllus bimaculatus]